MARKSKIQPIDAFRDSLSDAHTLMLIATAFPNRRVRRMRTELRERVGKAVGLRSQQRSALDCIQNDRVFLLFIKPDHLSRDHFKDTRPLLRQAIVAACAAFETYVADKAMDGVGEALRSDPIPKRLRDVPLTLGHWSDIERKYKRRTWGIRPVVEEAIREQSSTAPNKVGNLLGMVNVSGWSNKIDEQRRVRSGETVRQLEAITHRRNRIAHASDRIGQGRANLTPEYTDDVLKQLTSIANAIDVVVDREAALRGVS